MPYVEGESLRARIEREKRLPISDAIRLAREVASALDYSHQRGVVHRDIKPENILLASGQAMVADFGIARAVRVAGGEKLTTTGAILGTPRYMSPEQALGAGELDGRSDVYALGCVLFEMIAGQPPFTGPVESVVHQHMTVVPRSVTELRPSTPAATASAVARALEKVPADRFATAGEFVEALESSAREAGLAPASEARGSAPVGGSVPSGSRVDPPNAGPRGRSPARFPLRASIVAAAALSLVGLGVWKGPAWLRTFQHRDAPPAHKEWILVAEFEGADSSTASAARDLVSAAIDESEIAMTVPRDQIRLALESADKPGNTRLTREVAREIAFRSSVRTVLEGRLGRLGKGLTLTLELNDVDSSRVLFRAIATAKSDNDLIRAVDRIGRKLRASLGENRDAVSATRELSLSRTGSFEALKQFLEGRRLADSGFARKGMLAFREALALDPDFAACWTNIGVSYRNLGDADSAVWAFQQALRHPGRLTESTRLVTEGSVAEERGDLASALALAERRVEVHPDASGPHNDLGVLYTNTGRFEQALIEYRRALEADRFGPNQVSLSNLWETLLATGDTHEALRVSAQLGGAWKQSAPIWTAVFLEQWVTAENLAAILVADPTASADARCDAFTCLAAVQSARGRLRDARRSLERAQSIPETNCNELHAAEFLLVLAGQFSGLRVPLPEPVAADDPSINGDRVRAIHYAAAGDTSRARQMWRVASHRVDPEGLQGTTPLLEALIVARQEPRRVVNLLAGAGRTGMQEGRALLGPARSATPWLVAEAFEKLGERDSAAAYYEHVLVPHGAVAYAIPARAMATSFAHQRLVMLYLRLGRLEDARRHWEAFRTAFTRPDPELRPLLDETRAALASAEGMTKSQ